MNITIACDVLGEANNGTTIATLNLIRYLIKKGHNVKVVSNSFEGTDIPAECQCLLPTLDLGSLANSIIKNNGVSLAKIDNNVLYQAIEDADVVHIQMPLMLGRAAVKVARSLDKPITASFHCQAENVSTHIGMENNLMVSKAIYQSFNNSVYKYCDCVHYPTVFIKKTFEKACHCKSNAFVISNGVNTIYKNNHVEHHNEKFVIASTGRFSTEKAQELLIKAVAKSKYKDQIALKFAGEGPLLEKYIKLADSLGVDANFSFYTRSALVDMLNTADLYVHSAFIEIEAISCIEAICCGVVPVINNAKRSATKAFALDEKSLFKENSVHDLTKKIEYWIEHPEEKAEYIKKYEVFCKQFEQEECMKQMEEMLIEAKRIH